MPGPAGSDLTTCASRNWWRSEPSVHVSWYHAVYCLQFGLWALMIITYIKFLSIEQVLPEVNLVFFLRHGNFNKTKGQTLTCQKAKKLRANEWTKKKTKKKQSKKNTWSRHIHKAWSVTSECQFHCPKLYVQAAHYRWNGQGVVTWNLLAEHPMPWRLSICAPKLGNCIKGTPCNVKTIEWGPEILSTFLAECDFENFTVTPE